MTMFTDWLSSTRELQTISFKRDPATLEGAEAAEYLRWNTLAAIKEIGEALDEVDWKPWGVTDRGIMNRDAFMVEIVDAMHFLGNMLVCAGVTDEELSEHYRAKQQVNRDRQASGNYTGTRDK